MNKPIFILGDLNCNLLKESPEKRVITELCDDVNLKQIIKDPTRITDTSQSLIDIILVSTEAAILESGVLHSTISDHFPIYVITKLKVPKIPPTYITVRSYRKYDPTVFSTDLATKSDCLLSIFTEADVNAKTKVLKETIQSTLNLHAPIKTIKIRSRTNTFVAPDTKELMSTRDKLHQRFLKSRCKRDWEKYRESRNKVKVILKEASINHLSDEVKANKNNPGSLWKIINKSIPVKEKEKHIYTKELKTVVEDFNKYFTSVGKITATAALDLANKNNIVLSDPLVNDVSYPMEEQFKFEPVTCSKIQRIITDMPRNKSPGPDKLSIGVVKDCLPVILGPLTNIINCSFQSGMFPDLWKLSEVIPLLKEGDHETPSNNRPLSLLEVLSKVCEKVALDQFGSYITEKQRLSPHQNGNRKHHSTETFNIFITDKMLEAMDNKHVTALVLLDLSKAYDSISHKILLHKLKCVGASPPAIKWFESYLSGRTQYVRIRSTISPVIALTHGVPQGSILSPFLFGIYVNDLPAITISSDLDSYVDDSKLHLAFLVEDIQQAILKLEFDLHKTAKWCLEHQLLINPNKTKFLLVGTRSRLQNIPTTISLKFLGETLRPVPVAKDLGMQLDLHLSYDEHISKLSSTCIKRLCQINRVKESFDKETLSLIIEALVINKLLYCSNVWANTSSSNLKKLQTVQNFACRIITNIKKFDHVTPGYLQLKWLTIDKLLIYKDAVMAYKCLNNLAPSYLTKKFIKRSDIHNCQTRNNHNLDIPSYKSATGQRTFYYRAVKIWNELDDDLKNISELKRFKKKLKEYLLNFKSLDL